MKNLAIISLVLILMSATLFSDNVKALGSSFSMLIPDSYEDAKQFPDRINLEKNSSIEVRANDGMDGTAFIGYSRIGERFKVRHDFSCLIIDESHSSAMSINAKEIVNYDSKNQIGFHIGSINFGISTDLSREYETGDKGSLIEEYDASDFSVTRRENSSSNFKENLKGRFGISAGFGKKKSLSVALGCEFVDYNDDHDISSDISTTMSDTILYRNHNNNGISKYLNYADLNLSIIKDFGEDKLSRFYTKFNYRWLDKDGSFSSRNEFASDNSLDQSSGRRHTTNEYSTGDVYSVTLGYGNTRKKGKLEIHTAIKGSFSYANLEKICRDYITWDSPDEGLFSSTTDYSYTVKKSKDYYVELKVPLGISYNVTDWCKLSGSITISGRMEYYDSPNDMTNMEEDSEKYGHLSLDASNNLSIEFQPTKKLQLGIYNMNSLSEVGKWKVGAKYDF